MAVKNQRRKRCGTVTAGGRDSLHHRLQNILNTQTRFGRNQQRIISRQADNLLNLLFYGLRVSVGQVNLVDNRDNFQIIFQRQIHIGQRLRLNALGGIHHQQSTLAGSQRTADLIVEVNMAGGINQIKGIGFTVFGLIIYTHGL